MSSKRQRNIDALAASVLAYALWPSLTFAVVALWVTALLDIGRHTRGSTFSRAGLLAMAALVSVVAVVTLSGIGALFAGQWFEAISKASSDIAWTNEVAGEGTMRAYTFSFGMENAPYASPAGSGKE